MVSNRPFASVHLALAVPARMATRRSPQTSFISPSALARVPMGHWRWGGLHGRARCHPPALALKGSQKQLEMYCTTGYAATLLQGPEFACRRGWPAALLALTVSMLELLKSTG